MAAIVLAVAALLIYRRGGVDGDDQRCRVVIAAAETYRQPCAGLWRSVGDLSTDSPVRQFRRQYSSDEEQLVAQVERLLTLPRRGHRSCRGVYHHARYTPSVAVLAGDSSTVHHMATVRRRAGVNDPWLLWSGLSTRRCRRAGSHYLYRQRDSVATSTEAMPAQ